MQKKHCLTEIVDISLEPDPNDPTDLIYNLFQPFIKNKVSDFKITRMAEYERFKEKFKITSDILDFVNQLTKDRVRFLLAGGKMIDWFNNKSNKESTNDYDLWFFSQSDYDKALLYFKELKIDGTPSSYLIKPYLVEFVWKLSDRVVSVQCVAGCFSGPEEVLQEFDITASSIGYDGNYIYWNLGTLQDIRKKILRFQTFREYKLVWLRVFKYLKKGYSISNSNLAFASIMMLSTVTASTANQSLLDFFFDTNIPLDISNEYYEVDPKRDKWKPEILLNTRKYKSIIHIDQNDFGLETNDIVY